MKKQLLCTTILGGLAWLAFSSHTAGTFAGGDGNHTGSTGAGTANCSTGSNCHAANTTNTAGIISISPLMGGSVSKYTPGITYKVSIVAGNNSASLPRFGFQATCVRAASTTVQAGTFTSTAPNISVLTTPQPNLVEHNTPIPATSSGSNLNTYEVSFNWTAPAAGTGTVRFFATINAVNSNSLSTGDQPNTLTPIDLDEASGTGIGNVRPAQLSIYPNPASATLHLKTDGMGHTCRMLVRDITGRIVLSQMTMPVAGEMSIDIAGLNPGNYFVQAEDGTGQQHGALFVKQ